MARIVYIYHILEFKTARISFMFFCSERNLFGAKMSYLKHIWLLNF